MQRTEAVVIVHASINEAGGLVDYRIEPGAAKGFITAVEETLLHTRFSAPKPGPELRNHDLGSDCVPWTQEVTLRYAFSSADAGPRATVTGEFAPVGQIDGDAVAEANSWMDEYQKDGVSKLPGFVAMKPLRRVVPTFEGNAVHDLREAPAFAPQVAKAIMRVNERGRVVGVIVLGNEHPKFKLHRAVRVAASGFLFDPARLDGVPVPRVACQRFNFTTDRFE